MVQLQPTRAGTAPPFVAPLVSAAQSARVPPLAPGSAPLAVFALPATPARARPPRSWRGSAGASPTGGSNRTMT